MDTTVFARVDRPVEQDPAFAAHCELALNDLRDLVPSSVSLDWMDNTFHPTYLAWDLDALQHSIVNGYSELMTTVAKHDELLQGSYVFARLCDEAGIPVPKAMGVMIDLLHIANTMMANIVLGSHGFIVPAAFRGPGQFGVWLNQMWFARMIGYVLLHRPTPFLTTLQKNQAYRVLMEERLIAGLGRAHVLSWLAQTGPASEETEYDQAVQDMGVPAPLGLAVRLFQLITPDSAPRQELKHFCEDAMVIWQLQDEYGVLHRAMPSGGMGPPREALFAWFFPLVRSAGRPQGKKRQRGHDPETVRGAYKAAIEKRQEAIYKGSASYGHLLPLTMGTLFTHTVS